jgi:hypothetical protein
VERVLRAPALDALPPGVEPRRVGLLGAILGEEPGEDVLRVADDRDVGGTTLEISAGSTSMWTNFARGANSESLPGDPVVEAGRRSRRSGPASSIA